MTKALSIQDDFKTIVCSGTSEAIEFLRVNSENDYWVWQKIRDFIIDTLAELREKELHYWPYMLNIRGPGYKNTLLGETIRAYKLEAIAGPKLNNPNDLAELEECAKQLQYFQCFLEIDKDNQIVDYIEVVKTH